MKADSAVNTSFINLLNLPKSKALLDFIKQKLLLNSSSERQNVIEALLEMHRTSEGFDPASLCKSRISRVKTTEIKKYLIQLDGEAAAILESAEYKEFIHKNDGAIRIYEKLEYIKTKMKTGDLTGMEKQINELKEIITTTGDNDLLLALYKFFNSKQAGRTPDPEIFLRHIKM